MWNKMLELIEEYEKDKISATEMVGKLAGTMEAAEIKDKNIITKWNSYWGVIYDITEVDTFFKNTPTKKGDIEEKLNGLKKFIIESAQTIRALP
jgi:hypothetical protein